MIGKLIRSASGMNAQHNRVLVEYVFGTRERDKAAYTGARGFVSDSLDAQLVELTALAHATRSDATPLKHLMFSFRQGEEPTAAQVHQVVEECMRVAGLSASHQALFALHRNTQNAHIHVVLNTVDPTAERVTPVEYWHDVLAEVCVRLERRFGFAPESGRRVQLLADGTLIQREGGRAVAGPEVDGQEHSGIASAKTLARRDRVCGLLKSSRSWDEVHQRLARYGWTYEPKGPGAILRLHRTGRGDVAIKPSQIDAALGFGKLARRLGPFKPANNACVQPRDIEPARPELQPAGLWRAYRAYREEIREARKQALKELRRRHVLERARLVDRMQRQVPETLDTLEDPELYASIHEMVRSQQLESLRARQAGERAELSQTLLGCMDYEPWLEQRVEQNPGDDLAVGALRIWQIRHTERMAWSTEHAREVPVGLVDLQTLFHGGSAHYQRDGVTRFTDEGARISAASASGDDDVLAFLTVAQAKWGVAFNVLGSDRFIDQCARVAATSGLRIQVLNHPEFGDLVEAAGQHSARAYTRCGPGVQHRDFRQWPGSHKEESCVETVNGRDHTNADIQPSPEADQVMLARWALAHAWAVAKQGPSWGAEHDFQAAVALRAAGVSQEDVGRALLTMTLRVRVPGSPGWEDSARRGAAAAFGSFGDRAVASIDRDRGLADQLRQSMRRADAKVEGVEVATAAPGTRDAVTEEVGRGVDEPSDPVFDGSAAAGC